MPPAPSASKEPEPHSGRTHRAGLGSALLSRSFPVQFLFKSGNYSEMSVFLTLIC